MDVKSTYAELEQRIKDLEREVQILKKTEEDLREEHSFRTAVIERAAEGLCVFHEIAAFPYIQFTVWNVTGWRRSPVIPWRKSTVRAGIRPCFPIRQPGIRP